ncbi:MAG: hypothetical protein ONB31_00980 [candidate division KSB1 bacterium]|nr:hypothetical protein [candidate division KSB1 bacterium]MDZ7334887.1 hypothetical protein [candidate division KSB1 bacterium]MDZ7399343.1 hypothetical protein [candidate division KSB1 bacterium]
MKNVVSRFIFLIALCWGTFVIAQDIQEMYDAAKQALLQGDYMLALTRISDAQAQIEIDPNLDPNGVFGKKLLPKLQTVANNMAAIIRSLEALYAQAQVESVFPDLPPSVESVTQYTQMARSMSEKLIAHRDSILSIYELEPEFKLAIRNLPSVRQIEQFASIGIMDRLSSKFSLLAEVLTDSIRSINTRYAALTEDLEKLKRSAAASRAERKKLEQQLAALSQERDNYMHAISEMLMGLPTAENETRQMILLDQNLDTAFSTAIETEIKRVEAMTEVDSLGHKELLKNFERMKQYNQIFTKNNVAADHSALLARYEAAIQRVKVVQPEKTNYVFYIGIALAVLILGFIIYQFVVSSRKRKTAKESPDQRDSDF